MVRRKGRIKRIHTAKLRRCVRKVRESGIRVRSPYAICIAALGKKAFLKRR